VAGSGGVGGDHRRRTLTFGAGNQKRGPAMSERSKEPSPQVASEVLYRLLVEETPELLCLQALDGTFLFVNPASVAVLGYTPEELVGEDPFEMVHPDDRPALEKAHQAVLDGAPQSALTFRIRRKDGDYIWTETKANPLRALGDKITGVITSSRNVTDKVRLLEELDLRESTLRSVISSFDDLVFVFDGEGRFREYFQPGGREVLYTPPEEFVGRHHSEVLPPPVSEPLGKALASVVEGESVAGFEYELELGPGRSHFEARLSPLVGADGAVQGAVGVVREVTERKAEERQRLALIRATAQAERLESLAYLAGGAAHEFNNLLTVIQGNLLMAREEALEPPEAGEGIDAALEAASKAASVTRRLLASVGELGGPMASVDVGALVAELEGELLEGLGAGIELTLEVEEALLRVRGDEGRLREAVREVVANAGEAVAEGGRIRVRVFRGSFDRNALERNRAGPPPDPGEFVGVDVHDDGRGIDPEVVPRIFEPFFTTGFIGRGLGLAEVGGTMRSHGGAVLVDSLSGEGTRVTLLVPVEKQ
jgi:PAS domain S-box-containing protein